MNGLDDPGEQEVFKGHQPGNGQKAVHRRRLRDEGAAGYLEMEDELIELVPDNEREQEEKQLNGIPHDPYGGPGIAHDGSIPCLDYGGMMFVILCS
jgi:hypothetical protein